MKNSKVFSANVNGTFTQIKAYKKVNFWESKDLAIAYLKDTINSMEKGTVTKVECFFAEKSE